MLASACLTEEGVEGVVSPSNGLVTWHLAIRLDAMFQAVELPAGIADLDTSLADVDGDALTLWTRRKKVAECDTRGTSKKPSNHFSEATPVWDCISQPTILTEVLTQGNNDTL